MFDLIASVAAPPPEQMLHGFELFLRIVFRSFLHLLGLGGVGFAD